MKFDTVIIGGGLAGLTCGIALAQQHQHCAIISTGQSALHFSSGSFDLLNALPDGTAVSQPLASHQALIQQAPAHPYSRFSTDQFADYAQQVTHFLTDNQLIFHGHYTQNHYRISPTGQCCPTWLTHHDAPRIDPARPLPWKQAVLVDIYGFLDFHPNMVADHLTELGLTMQVVTAELPELNRLRENPSEFRSINIAHIFDHQPIALEKLANLIRPYAQSADVIFLPACLGLFNTQSIAYIKNICRRPVYLLPTLPPSLLGMKIYHQLVKRFQQLGGQFVLGDKVMQADISQQHVNAIYTRNHTDIPFTAQNFVLASGSFFSHGLASTRHEIYEPIFQLDIATSTDRQSWSHPDFFASQPYLQFGVETDHVFRAQKNGHVLDNLFAIGAILAGFDPLQQGCGAGVSLLTALYVADHIARQGD